MPFPFAAPLIGGAIGALGSLFGGGPDDVMDEESRRFFNEQIRGMGGAVAQGVTGFDPATGQFGMPTGPFAGPLTEQFGPESIDRFMNPFLGQVEGVLRSDRDRALDMNRRRSIEVAAQTGSQRGSRAGVVEAEGRGRVEDAFLRNLVNLRLGGFERAGNLALGAQPFRNQFLQEPLQRARFGMEAANFGLGPREAFLTPEAQGQARDPNPISGFLGGAISGLGFGGFGGGSTQNAGIIPGIQPPQGILPGPGPNLTPSPLPLPPQLGLPPIG